MSSKHSDLVKLNFEQNYQSYDGFIHQVVPGYEDLHYQIINIFNEYKRKPLSIIDLGVGTGKTAKALCEMHKDASIVWYDISTKMLAFANERLRWYNCNLIEQDILNISFKYSFDACVSVLAIHHLNNWEKKILFKKIFESLTDGWIFVIGDRIDFYDSEKRKTKLEFFKNFLVENLWVSEGNKYYDLFDKEDQPSTLEDQLQWLQEVWFSEVICVWEYSIYAVFYAIK